MVDQTEAHIAQNEKGRRNGNICQFALQTSVEEHLVSEVPSSVTVLWGRAVASYSQYTLPPALLQVPINIRLPGQTDGEQYVHVVTSSQDWPHNRHVH